MKYLIRYDILWDVVIRRVVLDTSVVVAALRTRTGAGNAVLRLAAAKRIKALVSPPLFMEYEAVLKRPEQQLVHGFDLLEIDEFLAEFAALVEPVEVHFRWRPQVRDPADEMVFEVAVNGNADALVTYNVADFAAAAAQFNVRVMRPSEILREVKR